jgi:CubicO group peptidase (beta-lactamase class C family)
MTTASAFSHQDEQFPRAFQLLADGIEQRAFPGASIAVTHQGALVALKGLGRFTYDPTSSPVSVETIYDLASVTKVVATTALCMVLHERGLLHLDQKLVEILPEFGGSVHDARRQSVTLRLVLAHSSGLPAYVKLFERTSSPEELVAEALRTPLTADPGVRTEYSDIGFILLGKVIEKLTGEPFEQLCRQQIFSPLGLAHMTFTPRVDWKPMSPPTVDDRSFRRKIIQCEVHDENAWTMGGIAGHAGCFSTARDVARFAGCMLRGGAPLMNAETIRLFTQRQSAPAGTSRALGWDTPSQPSQSGRYFSPHSFGHLGYTGTSLWIDPERQLSVTLLTNRTWPDCGSQLIRQIRPAFHDAIVEAL